MSNSSQQSETPNNGFLCTTGTIEDLTYTPSSEERSRDAAQIKATGRRSWKTLKGKGEAVWPLNLEAVLIEALEKYRPEAVGVKPSKSFCRFPMRNRFVSDYIFVMTGKRRTPKQVGSRLQQLRDTCKVEGLLKLLTHQDSPSLSSASSLSDYSYTRSPSPSSDHEFRVIVQPTSRPSRETVPIVVNVQISLGHDAWPTSAASIYFVSNSPEMPQVLQVASSSCSQGRLSAIPFSPISVQFPSATSLSLNTSFFTYVNSDTSNTPISEEIAHLRCVASPVDGAGWIYTTQIVPHFWSRLRMSSDITKYTILQTIRPVPSFPTCSASLLNDLDAKNDISIVYKFTLPPPPASRQRTQSDAYSGLHYAYTQNVSPLYPLRPLSVSTAHIKDEFSMAPQPSEAEIWQQYPQTYGSQSHSAGQMQGYHRSRSGMAAPQAYLTTHQYGSYIDDVSGSSSRSWPTDSTQGYSMFPSQ